MTNRNIEQSKLCNRRYGIGWLRDDEYFTNLTQENIWEIEKMMSKGRRMSPCMNELSNYMNFKINVKVVRENGLMRVGKKPILATFESERAEELFFICFGGGDVGSRIFKKFGRLGYYDVGNHYYQIGGNILERTCIEDYVIVRCNEDFTIDEVSIEEIENIKNKELTNQNKEDKIKETKEKTFFEKIINWKYNLLMKK